MSERFKLTDDEVNEVVLNSPYSLADSPASLGQRAKQIKKYFYVFIYTLSEKINEHLREIGAEIDSLGVIIESLKKSDLSLGESIEKGLLAHNENSESHPDIREKITALLSAHNESALSHADIRETLSYLRASLELCYSLSSGKSLVYTYDDIIEMLEDIESGKELFVGDFILIADPSAPDFTVFETGAEKREADITISVDDVSSGAVVPEAQRSYFINGVRLISSQGNLETSRLAKREELENLENELLLLSETLSTRLSENEALIKEKEKALPRIEKSEGSVDISISAEYSFGLLDTLLISYEEGALIEAIINLKSGEAPPSIDAPASLVFEGDDTLDGLFYPVSNRIYEINIKTVLGVNIARVCATNYEEISN